MEELPSAFIASAQSQHSISHLKLELANSQTSEPDKPYTTLSICLQPENIEASIPALLKELGELSKQNTHAFLLINTAKEYQAKGVSVHLYIQAEPPFTQASLQRLQPDLSGLSQQDADISELHKAGNGLFLSQALSSSDRFELSRGAAVASAIRKTSREGYFIENLAETLKRSGIDPYRPEWLLTDSNPG